MVKVALRRDPWRTLARGSLLCVIAVPSGGRSPVAAVLLSGTAGLLSGTAVYSAALSVPVSLI